MQAGDGMQLDQIRYFYETAQHKSINRAAEALYMNQPSLSKSLKLLEAELGTPLFIRTNKGVQLTPFGEEFYVLAGQMLELEDAAYRKAKDYADRKRYQQAGLLQIYLDPYVKEILFPKHGLRFMRLFPKIKLNLVEMDAGQVIGALLDAQLDLALVDIFPAVLEQVKGSPRLAHQILMESEPYLLVNERSPLARQKRVSIQEINSSRLIYSSLLSVKTYELEYNFSTSSPQLVLNALTDDAFCAMVPSFSTTYFLEKNSHLQALPIYDLKNITTVAITPAERCCDFAISQFVETIFPNRLK